MDCSPVRLLRPWDFPGKNTGVGCHFLLQDGILILCNFYFMLKEICKVIISLPYFKKKYDEDLPSTGVTNKGTTQQCHTCVCWQTVVACTVCAFGCQWFQQGLPWWLTGRSLPSTQETWVRSLGQEDPLEEGKALHSSTPAHRILWTEEPGDYRAPGHKDLGGPFSYNRAFCGDRDQASGVKLSAITLVAQTVKNLQCRKPGLIPWLGRARGEGNGYLLQYPCLENSMDREVWQATVHVVAKSWDMTEWLTLEELVANSDAYLEIENWSVATIKFPSCKPLYNVDENCSEFAMNSCHQMLKSKKCTVPMITQVKLFLLWSTSAGKPCWCWVLSWVIMCSLWPKA